jgi:LuxR family maltose regulon positive regulatory protein
MGCMTIRRSAFPATKFSAPRSRARLVDRPGLVEALARDVLTVPLTLLRAPAGYGKTTLAATMTGVLDADIAWLCVDADDNDPMRFLTGLGIALATVRPGLDGVCAEVFAADPDAVRRASVALLNAVAGQPGPVVVVLDEWETVHEPPVHAVLEYLAGWAPLDLHFVVTTREEPPLGLARLRARGQVAERGPADLRFTEAEAMDLFTGQPADAIARAYRRTEGWPAGLWLLANSLGSGDQPVHAGESDVFAFLAEEVFDRQRPDLRQFLLATSVLAEVSVPACVAVTGRDDAPEVLNDVAARGLFLTAQGDEYRYHSLFRDFLGNRRGRWAAAQKAALHTTAATVERDPVAVVRHLLAAGDPGAAADLLAAHGQSLLRLGRAASVEELLAGFPGQQPALRVLAGDIAFAAGDVAGALRAFEQAGPTADVLTRLADCRYLDGEIDLAADLVERARAAHPDQQTRLRLTLLDAKVAHSQGRLDRAEDAIDMVLGDRLDEHAVATVAAHLLPSLFRTPGGVHRVARFVAAARRLDAGALAGLQVDAIAITVDLLLGRLATLAADVERVRTGYRAFGGAPPFVDFVLTCAQVLAAAPGAAPVDDLLVDLARQAELLPSVTFARPNSWFLVGRATWQRGRFAEAREALAHLRHDCAVHSTPMLTMHRLSLEGLLAMSDDDNRTADQLLRAAVTEEDRTGEVNIYGSARVRLAYLCVRRGRHDEAMRLVEPVLADCERDGLAGRILFEGAMSVPVLELAVDRGVRPAFVALLRDRLAGAGTLRPVAVPGANEVLTAREVEVLRLLMHGATNREIARRLVLGEETVKTHVSRVLRKLGSRTRTAASAKARELGLAS